MAQTIARYGKPLSEDIDSGSDALPDGSRTCVFMKNSFAIIVTVVKGVVESESFSKEDSSGLSSQEIETILQADTSDGKWRKVSNSNPLRWKRGDGARAFYFSGSSATHTPPDTPPQFSGDGSETVDSDIKITETLSPTLLLQSKAFHQCRQAKK
jgi:hypothetical protein